MNNQKMIVGAMLLGFSIVAAKATTDAVVLTQNGYSYSVGGEFKAITTQNFTQYYAPAATVGQGFETFCIECTVEYNPGQTYTYNLSDKDSRGVDLSEGAAYLYYEFGKGDLANYNYTDQAIRNVDAGELQAAIWWFQGEQTYPGYPSPTDNIYYEEAVNTLGLATADSPNNRRYAVDVLQLWDAGEAAQNQLVLVPDSGATGGLLALGLTALAVARRRFQAA
jgi:hypothetical protein